MLSPVPGLPLSLDPVLATGAGGDMTQERDKALSVSPLAREPAPDDPNPSLLPRRPPGGLGRAPPGRDAFLSCLGGVFLNRDSLTLPEPLWFTPRPFCVSLTGERSPLLLVGLLALPLLLPSARPFLEVDKLVLAFLLRESEEDVVPITKNVIDWLRQTDSPLSIVALANPVSLPSQQYPHLSPSNIKRLTSHLAKCGGTSVGAFFGGVLR